MPFTGMKVKKGINLPVNRTFISYCASRSGKGLLTILTPEMCQETPWEHVNSSRPQQGQVWIEGADSIDSQDPQPGESVLQLSITWKHMLSPRALSLRFPHEVALRNLWTKMVLVILKLYFYYFTPVHNLKNASVFYSKKGRHAIATLITYKNINLSLSHVT